MIHKTCVTKSNLFKRLVCLAAPKAPESFSSDIPELLILQGFSLNVCFNFACLFELKKCFFLFSLPSKMADAPFLKIPSNFYTASIFIGLRNTGRRLTAKHQMPFISLTLLKDKKREKKSCFVRKILLIIMTMTFFMTNVTSRGRKMLLIMISTCNLQSYTPLLSIINS